jgi:hypothetical protein
VAVGGEKRTVARRMTPVVPVKRIFDLTAVPTRMVALSFESLVLLLAVTTMTRQRA